MTRGNRSSQVFFDDFISDDLTKKEIAKTIEKSPTEVETPVPPTVTNGVIANALYVKVRKEPDFESDVLEVLPKGDKVTILEKGKDFWKVSTSINKIAYISSQFVKEE